MQSVVASSKMAPECSGAERSTAPPPRMIGVPRIKIESMARSPVETVVGSGVVAAHVMDKAAMQTATGRMRSGGATSSNPAGMATENVVIASESLPLPAISLSEVLATSDVPGGVINVLTGSAAEIAPWLASHADVNGIDLAGAEALDWVELQIAAAETLTRVLPPVPGVPAPALDRMLAFTETKTVWHTKSLI